MRVVVRQGFYCIRIASFDIINMECPCHNRPPQQLLMKKFVLLSASAGHAAAPPTGVVRNHSRRYSTETARMYTTHLEQQWRHAQPGLASNLGCHWCNQKPAWVGTSAVIGAISNQHE